MATLRVGMLTPSSNTVLEPATAALAAPLPDLSVHFSRFRVTAIDEEASARQFRVEPMLEAARLLADAKVDVICWNGTSGGWEGLDADRELAAAIEAGTGMPVTTGTLSLLDAFAELGVRRYALVCPYVDSIAASIRRTFAGAGFECAAASNERVSVNFDFALIGPERIAGRAREVASARPDAVAIFCTNLRGWDLAEALSAELGLPVLDSVVVCLWGALRAAGRDWAAPGFRRTAGA